MIYKWKHYYHKTDATVAGEVCEELDKTVGLTPQNLVDASRPEDAPLHREFEWDDTIAAEEYRRVQARHIITNLAVVIEEKKQEPVRAFFSLEYGFKKNEGAYESTVRIMSDEEMKARLLEKAKAEMIAFKSKYKMLRELDEVFASIDHTQMTIWGMKENEE